MKEEFIRNLEDKIKTKKAKIAVLGLGYVGFPLSLQIIKSGFSYVGFDVNKEKIAQFNNKSIPFIEFNNEENLQLLSKTNVKFTHNEQELEGCDFYILCVPTPVDDSHTPDLSYVSSAAEIVARVISKGSIVILESTVYPGVTEEIVGKIIREKSEFVSETNFGLANCPERISPGDEIHTIENIERVVGGCCEKVTDLVAEFYSLVIDATIHKAKSIKTAEASKVIENTQRDVNIALMNEFALIFERMGLDVMDVIEAASSKWNFIKLTPGAGVGGHCLPHDPLYLANKSSFLGYVPQLIYTARKLNDFMPIHASGLVKRGLNEIGKSVKDSHILILGASYKADLDDIRSSPTKQFIDNISSLKPNLTLIEPNVQADTIFGIENKLALSEEILKDTDAIVLLTAHTYFKKQDWSEIRKKINREKVVFVDGRRTFDPEEMLQSYYYMAIGRSIEMTR